MTPIHYTRAQVALMIRFAGGSATPESFGLTRDGAGYVWQPR